MPPKEKKDMKKLLMDTWTPMEESLRGTMDSIRNEKQGTHHRKSTMDWYTAIYNAATNDQQIAKQLYDHLHKFIHDELKKVAEETLIQLKKGSPEQLFAHVSKTYKNFKILMKVACTIFRYLDTYFTHRSKVDTVGKMFLKAFHAAVYEGVKGQLVGVILRMVQSSRDGNRVQMEEVQSAVAVFLEVGASVGSTPKESRQIYQTDFECHYLSALEEFYGKCSAKKLSTESGYYSYLAWTDTRFQYELRLGQDLMDEVSMRKIEDKLVHALLFTPLEQLVRNQNSGLKCLLMDGKDQEVAVMYRLLRKVKDDTATPKELGEYMMRGVLEEFVCEEGNKLLQDYQGNNAPEANRTVFEHIVVLYAKFEVQNKVLFESSSIMKKAVVDAFKKFLNVELVLNDKPMVKKTTFSEILSSFVDLVLRKSIKEIASDSNKEAEWIDRLVAVFDFLKEKDVFQEHYKSRLAKRLLQTTPCKGVPGPAAAPHGPQLHL